MQSKHDEELKVAAQKFVKLIHVLPPSLYGKSILKMMKERGEGHAALEEVGITGQDILHLKIADFLPRSAASIEGFSLKTIAMPCAVFLARQSMEELERVSKHFG